MKDEEIASGVITGLRPEWPSDDPFEELTDALWREVQACWSYDPEERPTASAMLQTLQVLSQDMNRERPQGPQGSSVPPDDEAWDRIDDAERLGMRGFFNSKPPDRSLMIFSLRTFQRV